MSKEYYDVDTIDAIAKMVQMNIDHFSKMAHMWYEESMENDTINDNDALEWQMWNTDMDKIAVLNDIKESLEELKQAEIFRRANVVYIRHGYH